MTSFNILGDCVSRDIVTPLINEDTADVFQYHAFSNPICLFSGKGKFTIDVENITTEDSDFRKRCAVLDINKSALDYVFAQNSDYIIVDFLDARLPILQKDNHMITISNCIRNARSILDERFELSSYEEVSPFDFPAEQWKETVVRICDIIKKHYSPEQVILNKHFGVESYIKDNDIFPYIKYLDFVKTFNALVATLFEIAESELSGCHIIDFPRNVLGDGNHQWGLYPLHYHQLYYDYGAKALKIIIATDSREEEHKKLSRLKRTFENKFKLKYSQIMQNKHTPQAAAIKSDN